MITEIKIFIGFLIAFVITIISYFVGIFVDSTSYGVIGHASFFIGVISLSCSLWVAWLANSIKSYHTSTISLNFLSEFVDKRMEPMAKKSRDGRMPFAVKMMLHNQIENALLVCLFRDSSARKMLEVASQRLKNEECYYADMLNTVREAISIACKNLN